MKTEPENNIGQNIGKNIGTDTGTVLLREGITYIEDAVQKEKIAGEILNRLPEWFGLPDSTREYIVNSRNMSFFVYGKEHRPAGFIVLKETGERTAEIYVMGVLKEYQGMGIGQELFCKFAEYAQNTGYKYLQVKTVEEGCYKEYDATVRFYKKVGFEKLECFPELWDEWNPCLVMVQSVESAVKYAESCRGNSGSC